MARHLLDAGYVHPAASLIGAVLENGLRQIASASGVNVKTSDDISALDTKLADAEIYSRLVQKRVRCGWMFEITLTTVSSRRSQRRTRATGSRASAVSCRLR